MIANAGRNGQARMHGIYPPTAGSDGTTIRGNRISGITNAESEGIHCNGDLSIGGDGLISDLTIEANTISSSGGNNAINFDGVQNALIRDNLVMASGHHALRAYAIDAQPVPRNLRVINNTFVTNNGWAVKLSRMAAGMWCSTTSLLGSAGSLAIGSPDDAGREQQCRGRNLLGRRRGVDASPWRHGAPARRRTLHRSAGPRRSCSSTPRPAGNFALSSSSPARDKGLSIFAGLAVPSTDLTGAPRQQGSAPDIGAIEYRPEPRRAQRSTRMMPRQGLR